MLLSRQPAKISTPDFDGFANDVAMAVWNAIAELPQFHHLAPTDYPYIYDAVLKILKRTAKK